MKTTNRKHRQNKSKAILVGMLLGVMSLVACNNNVIYHEELDMPYEKWAMEDVYRYAFDINDSSQICDMYINIRNTIDYPYENAYFFFTTTFPDGNKANDTLECILADKYGQWTGEGHGHYRHNRLLFKRHCYFPQVGTYRIEVRQAMREEIEGIASFGIELIK